MKGVKILRQAPPDAFTEDPDNDHVRFKWIDAPATETDLGMAVTTPDGRSFLLAVWINDSNDRLDCYVRVSGEHLVK
jgi:hypothetical protein